MNPYKLREIYKYLTRAKKVQPDLPDVFSASKAPIPPKTQNVQETEAVNQFMLRNPRVEKAGGGMLVQPSADGSRPGYANEKKLNKTMEKRISNYESKTGNNYEDQPSWRKKDIRDGNWTGGGKGEKFKDPAFIKQKSEGTQIQKVRNYLSSAIRENKGKPVTFKTISEIKKGAGVTANIDADITRALQSDKFKNKINLRNFEKLPDEIIKEIKSSFSNLVPKDKWNFNKYKFGINETDVDTRVYDRIRRSVEDPKPMRYGFQLGNPDGWMLTQMDRAYRSGNKSYKPIYAIVNGVRKVVGYVDNTDKGAGKKYFASDIYIKGKNSDGVLIKGTDKTLPHPDYAENVKYHDIVKKAGQPPNKAIRDILTKGGIAGSEQIQMRHVLNFLLDSSDYNAARNSIVRHHRGQLSNATSDLQILNRVQNVKVTGIEDRISKGNILPEDISKLKNFGVSVRGPDGTLYGGGSKTATGGLRDINKLILEGSPNVDLYGKEIKGLKNFSKKDFSNLKTYLSKIGCPGLASGGRAGFDVGTNCQIKGAELINSGMKNASPAQFKNFAAFANRTASLGRGVMKFGVIPEALFVAADSAIRIGMGDNLNEAFLRASDYLRRGDQTKQAEMLEADRFFGPEVAGIIGKSIDYKNQLANIQSLEDQKANLENLSGGGAFDYVGDTSQDVKNIDARLKQATDNLNNKFKMTDAEQIYANRMQEETDDARSSGSFFTKLKSKFRDVGQDQSDIETLGMPEKTQKQLNEKILPAFGDSKDFITLTTADAINLAQAYRAQGSNVSAKDILAYRDSLRNASLSELAQQFNPESVYGASGTMGEPINKPPMEKKPNIIPEMEKEIVGQTNVANPFDLDLSMIGSGLRGFSAAGGGIAKMAGDSSGPPPVRGPNPQGLLSLKNRVRNY
jgi:hypothetical protein